MKKIILVIACIVIIIIAVFCMKYIDYKEKQSEINQFNAEYESYLDNEITGVELTSIIDKIVDNNEQNSVEKDDQGFYIQNDSNSIKLEIKMLDDDGNTYQMETIYNGGMSTFMSYYSDIKFKCTKIEYNLSNKVSYIVFEQTTT